MSHHHPRLILLNGPPGVGKSVIAKKYIQEHPFAFIDDDQLIGMMGQWIKHEDTARELVFELTKSMADIYLRLRHTVIVPYLVLNPKDAAELEEIAERRQARFYECTLLTDRQSAIKRLLRRGTWGEADLPPITQKDVPYIGDLYDRMETAVAKRPQIKKVVADDGDIEGTYHHFLAVIDQL